MNTFLLLPGGLFPHFFAALFRRGSEQRRPSMADPSDEQVHRHFVRADSRELVSFHGKILRNHHEMVTETL